MACISGAFVDTSPEQGVRIMLRLQLLAAAGCSGCSYIDGGMVGSHVPSDMVSCLTTCDPWCCDCPARHRYKVVKQLGDGTYGTVWKAVNRQSNEVVSGIAVQEGAARPWQRSVSRTGATQSIWQQ